MLIKYGKYAGVDTEKNLKASEIIDCIEDLHTYLAELKDAAGNRELILKLLREEAPWALEIFQEFLKENLRSIHVDKDDFLGDGCSDNAIKLMILAILEQQYPS